MMSDFTSFSDIYAFLLRPRNSEFLQHRHDGCELVHPVLISISIVFLLRLQPLNSPVNLSLAEMPSQSPSDPLKKLRDMWRDKFAPGRALHNHSTTAGVLAVSKPLLAFSSPQPCLVPIPRESTVVSIYRNTSDAAQTFLPPVQAVAGVIPGVGGIIQGVIGGITNVLQLVDVIQFHSCMTPDAEPRHH